MTKVIRDFMFGDHTRFDKRLGQHRQSLTGVQHRSAVDPAHPQAGETILLNVTTSAGFVPGTAGAAPGDPEAYPASTAFDAVRVYYTTDGTAPAPERARCLGFLKTNTTWDSLDWLYVTHWQASLPPQPDDTLVRYRIAARRTGTDEWVFADSQASDPAQATDYAVWVSDLPAPAWALDAQVYHIFVDRFNPGGGKDWLPAEKLNGYFGGTIRGIIEKLDYIQDLGYNTVWLSPFFASPSHHGYDAIDMYTVEPRLGTNDDLYELIAALHARGMRIILDFVANHWSNLHFSMQAAQKDRHSPYYDWYIWQRWPDLYNGFFGVPDMPQLNLVLGSPARQYLLDCAKFWLEKGFDGYRLDFAYGPPLDFWVDFRRTCKQTRPDAWLFGEVIHSAPAQRAFEGAFDGMIDFLLAEALRQTFGYCNWSLEQFDAFLMGHENYFEGVFDRLTILDNHDMNRFLFLAGDEVEKLKLGALALYTLAGNPINYYGTEAGVSQARPTHYGGHGYFEEARAPMLWESAANAELIGYFRRLVGLRAAHPALRSANRRTFLLDSAHGLYGYLRQEGSETLVVVFNTSAYPRQVSLDGLEFNALQDLLGGVPVQRTPAGILSLTLPPQSGAILG